MMKTETPNHRMEGEVKVWEIEPSMDFETLIKQKKLSEGDILEFRHKEGNSAHYWGVSNANEYAIGADVIRWSKDSGEWEKARYSEYEKGIIIGHFCGRADTQDLPGASRQVLGSYVPEGAEV